jgi:hypothetical protein
VAFNSITGLSPLLQAMDVTIVNNDGDARDSVVTLINSLPLQVGLSATLCPQPVPGKFCGRVADCPMHVRTAANECRFHAMRPSILQHLVSLSVRRAGKHGRSASMQPNINIQLPKAMPRLQRLHFGYFCGWDALHRALWPLVDLAAQGASSRAAACGSASAGIGTPPHHAHESRSGARRKACSAS